MAAVTLNISNIEPTRAPARGFSVATTGREDLTSPLPFRPKKYNVATRYCTVKWIHYEIQLLYCTAASRRCAEEARQADLRSASPVHFSLLDRVQSSTRFFKSFLALSCKLSVSTSWLLPIGSVSSFTGIPTSPTLPESLTSVRTSHAMGSCRLRSASGTRSTGKSYGTSRKNANHWQKTPLYILLLPMPQASPTLRWWAPPAAGSICLCDAASRCRSCATLRGSCSVSTLRAATTTRCRRALLARRRRAPW